VSGFLIAAALVVALAVTGRRWWRRRLLNRRLRSLPAMQPETAMVVAGYDDIEHEVARRRCPCGGRFDNNGETSKEYGNKRLRVVRLECRFCEERSRIYFDVSTMFH
jgi:hypothetical protein